MRLYFAYGSNMAATQMRSRCPQCAAAGPARLPEHRWYVSHHGYASVAPQIGSMVHGVLWHINAADEAALDRFEDVAADDYRKHALTVLTEQGPRTALVYIDPHPGSGRPSSEYVGRINQALREADLPEDYVAAQIRPWIPADQRPVEAG